MKESLRDIIGKGGNTMEMKPILFNTEMVRAILSGQKRQTRRICKGQPQDGITSPEKCGYKPPYSVGDILYVRERFATDDEGEYHYYADSDYIEPFSWKPSIHMPKEAARIFLRVTDVRAERLRDITEDDAMAEGVKPEPPFSFGNPYIRSFIDVWDKTVAKSEIKETSWGANPWVWVITFERMEENESD